MPDIVGKTAGDAEKRLRAKELTLGQASPQPVDPKGKIASQIPAAGEVVKAGTPVNIFYRRPGRRGRRQEEGRGQGQGRQGRRRRRGGGGGGGGGGGAAADIIVPAIGGAKTDAVRQEGRRPRHRPGGRQASSTTRRRHAVRDRPARRHEGRRQVARSQLLVSVGQPQVVYTNGKNILRVNGAQRRRSSTRSRRARHDEEDPTWSADGDARRLHGRRPRDAQGPRPRRTRRRPADARPAASLADLAWAPTADRNVIAMATRDGQGTRRHRPLLRRDHKRRDRRSTCIDEPDFAVIRAIHWAPDGQSILGVGVKSAGCGEFGIVRWKVKDGKPAFSPDAGRLEQGPLRDRHRHAEQGRARRRGLARRQAARAGLQPGLVGLPAVARRRPGRLR